MNKKFKLSGMLILLLVTAGCANLTGSGTQLSAEQMKAMANDKNATAFCGIASGPWGKVITSYVVVDNKVIMDGGFSVDETCKVQFQNAKPATVVNVGQGSVAPQQVFTPSIR